MGGYPKWAREPVDEDEFTRLVIEAAEKREGRALIFSFVDLCPDDHRRAMLFGVRFMAWQEALGDDRAKPYRRQCGEDGFEEVSDATIRAAAVAPINEAGAFDFDAYFAEVAKRFAEDA